MYEGKRLSHICNILAASKSEHGDDKTEHLPLHRDEFERSTEVLSVQSRNGKSVPWCDEISMFDSSVNHWRRV
jgi:hypothetical protein